MVVLHLYVVLVALQNLLSKLRLLGSSIVAILEAVALLVGFGCYINTIFITKVVPYRVVRIVASANGIDVQALHNLDILNHALARNYITSVRVHLMTVCTLDVDRLTVYEELSILDFNLAEAHLLRNYLNDVALLIFHCSNESVEIRVFGAPLLHVLEHELCCAISALFEVSLALYNLNAIVVEELVFNYRLSFYLSINLNYTICIVVLKVGSDFDIRHMNLRVASIEIAIASHARKAPEVLVFAPRTITPAECLESDEVFALLKIRSNVEFCCHLSILCIASKPTIYIEIDVGSDGTKMSNDLLTIPIFRNVDDAAIAAHIIVLGRNSRRLLVEMSAPTKAYIYILWVAIAIHFPNARDVHGLPRTVVKVSLIEVGRTLVGILHPIKLPCTMEGKEVGTLRHVASLCSSFVLVGEIVGVKF